MKIIGKAILAEINSVSYLDKVYIKFMFISQLSQDEKITLELAAKDNATIEYLKRNHGKEFEIILRPLQHNDEESTKW